MERIDVVVTVIYCGNRLLLVRNKHWGFTLPMTKLQQTQLGIGGNAMLWESGENAAMRNVAECLHIAVTQEPRLLADVGDVVQSDRTGRFNFYQFQVYGFEVEKTDLPPGVVGQWFDCQQILDANRRPVSITSRLLVERLKEIGLDRGGNFPPVAQPPRHSVASIAIISRQEQQQRQWLCQWNENWKRFFLVGGHQKKGETPEVCMRRELREELRIVVDGELQDFEDVNDYHVGEPQPLDLSTDWSVGYWRDTEYEHTLFDVSPTQAGHDKIAGNPANRWLTRDEILSERCTDGKFVSPTTRKLLQKVGEL